jgi:outer membrane protein TolC
VTSLELLDAQEAFSQAQANYALAVLEMRLTGAEIRRLAGEGS